MVFICGIDDAGRGPLIGPMVLAGLSIPEKDTSVLKEWGVKDSKLLSPRQREILYEKIVKEFKLFKIIKIPPEEIDRHVLSSETNLNFLEADTMAAIINALKADQSIVDCPSTNKNAFANYLQGKLIVKTELRCEWKADRDFLQVGAASILAKVTRDMEIEKIKKKIGIDFGSGYPADPLTQQFLKKHWQDYPDIFRHSWSSYRNVAEGKLSKKQKTLEDF
ncbi:ribonuclease HII [Candidatus Woesearchaeota archaeon]|nr:ribonuclease HII [Candidatus Woesearchaeota archaeon]